MSDWLLAAYLYCRLVTPVHEVWLECARKRHVPQFNPHSSTSVYFFLMKWICDDVQ